MPIDLDGTVRERGRKGENSLNRQGAFASLPCPWGNNNTVNTHQVTVHPQKGVVRSQLGKPSPGSHTQGNEVLQQLPKPTHCVLLHCCKAGGRSLLLLVLPLLLSQLLPLHNLVPMLLLSRCEGSGLQQR